jgi:two-component system response regulator DegU
MLLPLSMQPVRILVANHHPIVRNSLRLLLEREPGFSVIGEAAGGREAVVLTEYRRPEIVLLDVDLRDLNGIAVAREISRQQKEIGIVFVTAQTDEGYIVEAIKAGARGYVAGDAAPSDLVRAIKVVANGGHFLSPVIGAQLLTDVFGISSGDPKH